MVNHLVDHPSNKLLPCNPSEVNEEWKTLFPSNYLPYFNRRPWKSPIRFSYSVPNQPTHRTGNARWLPLFYIIPGRVTVYFPWDSENCLLLHLMLIHLATLAHKSLSTGPEYSLGVRKVIIPEICYCFTCWFVAGQPSHHITVSVDDVHLNQTVYKVCKYIQPVRW